MEKMTHVTYLQSREADCECFGIRKDEVLHLVRLHYGICDAGPYWAVTFMAHVEGDLGMVHSTEDPALHTLDGADGLDGLLGAHVDDCILRRNETFQVLTEATLSEFEVKPRQWDNFAFLSVTITFVRGPDWHIETNLVNYIAALSLLELSATFDEFARRVFARARLCRLALARPDGLVLRDEPRGQSNSQFVLQAACRGA